jgi:hypothetical protein
MGSESSPKMWVIYIFNKRQCPSLLQYNILRGPVLESNELNLQADYREADIPPLPSQDL